MAPDIMRRGAVEEFSRYEFKYLLDADMREQVENEISNFMRYDGFAHSEMENSYIVRSLYFDDPERTHYYEKIDGQLDRRKYRLRTYVHDDDGQTPIFLEMKGRYNQRVYKRRARIACQELGSFLDPYLLGGIPQGQEDTEFLETFLYSSLRRRLSPVVLVDYIRRPYVSDYDMNFRVTFDSELRSAATGQLFPDATPPWKLAEPGRTIVEIKFNRRIPAWFHRIVQAYGLRRLSISKFCRGMEINGLAARLE
tara:strand:+ start:150 stop:908 length:759 start_codon:yes stop_codon:yes gene_type:complete